MWTPNGGTYPPTQPGFASTDKGTGPLSLRQGGRRKAYHDRKTQRGAGARDQHPNTYALRGGTGPEPPALAGAPQTYPAPAR